MPGYEVRISTITVGGHEFRIRALSDKQQFDDPDGSAERAGISSATWPIFGVLWPAGLILAEHLASMDLGGRRVLEVGCGLALSSLVLQRRGIDVTASDHHPLAADFLQANAALNHLAPVPFRLAQWAGPNPELGDFDVLVGSDILYERDHVEMLLAFFAEHARPRSTILITDPGRSHGNALSRGLSAQGYSVDEQRLPFEPGEAPPFRGRLLSYRR